MDQAHRGEAALNAGNLPEAIALYSEAIKQSPSAATYYIKRSTAYQRCSQYQEALDDADTAVVLATKRAKRELIALAQLRRGIALYQLGRYGDASSILAIARRLNPSEHSVGIWDAKVQGKLKELGPEDEAAKVTVKDMPEAKDEQQASSGTRADAAPVTASTSAYGNNNLAPRSPFPGGPLTPLSDISSNTTTPQMEEERAHLSAGPSTATGTGQQQLKQDGDVAASAPTAASDTPAEKIRHEWYQNGENVYITLFAKNIPKDPSLTQVEMQQRSVSVAFPLASGSSYDLTMEPLFGAIDVDKSMSRTFSTKLEIILRKAVTGQKWSFLEGDGSAAAAAASTGAAAGGATPSVPQAGPPTSSRSGPKNWDAIVSNYTKKGGAAGRPISTHASTIAPSVPPGNTKSNDAAKDTEDTDEVYLDDDEVEGDEVSGFFKKLYASADPDTRRAMMKSYQESGGTALSTNWAEVGKGPVAVSPPDGMEEKKW